ncbi:hypothetical protein GCM10010123_38620 [Pilimelia anulata]|uniref:DUF4360 domain-containing protein n=1 Tax=Pilimelia anulata TaxID=53371 RepID=A0A8J3FBJ0_9ACTN|nr:hypothetical protein [Pilimelia anulata]GGK04932.1 hypothetical protein GCM10010123_38620 [Pilimelia anulata]
MIIKRALAAATAAVAVSSSGALVVAPARASVAIPIYKAVGMTGTGCGSAHDDTIEVNEENGEIMAAFHGLSLDVEEGRRSVSCEVKFRIISPTNDRYAPATVTNEVNYNLGLDLAATVDISYDLSTGGTLAPPTHRAYTGGSVDGVPHQGKEVVSAAIPTGVVECGQDPVFTVRYDLNLTGSGEIEGITVIDRMESVLTFPDGMEYNVTRCP